MKRIIFIAVAALSSIALSAQGKFGIVNFNEVVMLMPEADEARKTLNAASKEADDTYRSMVEEAQAKFADYQAKQSSWTAAIKESKEKELNDIQTRIQEFQQSIQQELQMQQNQLMEPIYKKANDTIQKLAKAGGYIFVFDIAQYLYVDESQVKDLTPDVRKELGIPAGRTLETLQQELQAAAAQQ